MAKYFITVDIIESFKIEAENEAAAIDRVWEIIELGSDLPIDHPELDIISLDIDNVRASKAREPNGDLINDNAPAMA